jgi:hypothetical protein
VPIVAAGSLDKAGHPIHVKVAKVQAFSFAAIADWTQDSLARGWEVISDGLTCFRAVPEVGCIHQPAIVNWGLLRKTLWWQRNNAGSLRWSGFSGQPPSLTSEAGHRP